MLRLRGLLLRLRIAGDLGLAFQDGVLVLPMMQHVDVVEGEANVINLVCFLGPLDGAIDVAVDLGDDRHVIAGAARGFPGRVVGLLLPELAGAIPVTRLGHPFGDDKISVAAYKIEPGYADRVGDDACGIGLAGIHTGLLHGFFAGGEGGARGNRVEYAGVVCEVSRQDKFIEDIVGGGIIDPPAGIYLCAHAHLGGEQQRGIGDGGQQPGRTTSGFYADPAFRIEELEGEEYIGIIFPADLFNGVPRHRNREYAGAKGPEVEVIEGAYLREAVVLFQLVCETGDAGNGAFCLEGFALEGEGSVEGIDGFVLIGRAGPVDDGGGFDIGWEGYRGWFGNTEGH
jgi:hypothetical protein